MKRIAIFTEGESDMLFSSYLLKVIYGLDGVLIRYVKFTSDKTYEENYIRQEGYGDISLEFVLLNLGNDKRVVNKLRENGASMLEKGYDSVIGLRDLGSQEYDTLAKGKIDDAITKRMINDIRGVLGTLEIFFAVMELEAWYLALTDCLVRSGYNLDDINGKLGVVLTDVDPESDFYNPKSIISSFESNFNEIKFAHKIGSKVNSTNLDSIENGEKVVYFAEYIRKLKSYR